MRPDAQRIAIIGDAMTDIYISGYTEECQEQCPKFIETSREICLGGAANAAMSISAWGCNLLLVAQPLEFCIKTRYMEDDKCVFRTDQEEQHAYASYHSKGIAELVAFNPTGILLSDYAKGFLSCEFIRKLILFAKAKHIPIVADAKCEPSIYRGAIVKCNLAYARKYSWYKARVITRGALSPIVDDESLDLARDPVSCINIVGAGDCFAAHLVLGLACGKVVKVAAAFAHDAGRAYVQHAHNKPPTPGEVLS